MPFGGLGGTELSTLDTMQAISPYGLESVAICLQDYGPLHDLFRSAGFASVHYPSPIPSYRRMARFFASSRALAAEFKRLRLDLIHCEDFEAAYYTAAAGYFARLPILCHVRARFPRVKYRDRPFLWPVAHFVFVSESTRTQLDYPVPREKTSIIYTGIDTVPDVQLANFRETARQVRAELGFSPEVKLIGMMGHVAPQKDHETLIRAAVKVVGRYPGVRFLIVGDTQLVPDHYEHVLRVLAAAGMDKHFLFTGYRSDALRLLGALDIVVLSTHREGLPQVVVEAMAYAKPVVATDVDGIPEVIAHGRTGFLYPHEDADALAARLLDLLENPDLADRLGLAAREAVRADFSRENFTRSIVALYRRLLGSRAEDCGASEPC
jgi:glycosyltransferase involved in cell wall biosynthesis